MRKQKQKKLILITMFFLIFFFAFIVMNPNVRSESSPHLFKGFATDTTLRHIKDGVTVKAIVINVDGTLENYTTLVNNSLTGKNYDFYVDDPGPEEDNNGRPIWFYIGTENTSQMVPFVVGGLNENYSTYFNITIVDIPQITDNTNRTNGTTGDPFYFNVTALDYVDIAANLTVNVSWAHNGTSGNQTLSNSVGNYFTGNIILGQNVTDMVYTVWVTDGSGNTNSSGPHNVTVTDNDPPITSIEISEPLHPDSVTNNSNITSSSNIYLNTTDNIGNYYIHYRIWNTTNDWSSWNVGSADTNQIINLIKEGKNYLEYFANDTAGNNETTHNVTLWVDDSAPTTTLTINEQVHPSSTTGCNVTSSTTMTLSATDNPAHSSGVASTAYRYWNATNGWTAWTAYSGAFTLGSDEGKYYLEFNSTDNLGNAESSNNWTIWIDDTAPTTTIDFTSPNYPSATDGCNVTSSTTFTLTATDSPAHNSSVAFSWYTDNGVYHLYTVPFTLSGEGVHVITYGSQDNLGNNESANTITVWLDDSSPTTSITIGSPNYPSATDGCNITSATTFILNAIDYPVHNASVAFSWYTDNGAYHLYTVPFTLSGEGVHVITYGSQDNLGNNETGNSIIVYVDDSAPTTTLTIGSPNYPSATDGCNVTSSTTMTLSVTDNPAHNSGVASTAYRYWNATNGWTAWTAYSGAFTLGSDEGKYYLEFNSTDNLGNAESSNNWTIWVDNSAPTSTINTSYAYYHNTSLTITISVDVSNEANGSGIKNVTLYYYYDAALNNSSKANTSWEGPNIFSYDVNNTPWINLTNVSINFNFTNGSGYYRFFSVATDNLTNSENTSVWANQTNSTECFFNNTAPNVPQILSGPTTRKTGVSGTYTVNATDIDNDRLKFGWDWDNDGTVDRWDDNSSNYYASGEIASQSRSWSTTGTKTFKVLAEDEHGARSDWSSPYSVTVSSSSSGTPSGGELPPSLTADAGGPYSGQTGTPVTFTGSASYGSTPYTYSWNFGDGNTGTGQTVNHTYSTAGEYTVTLTVTDNNGDTDDDETTATISQSPTPTYPPVADAGGPYAGLTYQEITFSGVNSSDSDGTIQNYTWYLGDGTTLYGEQVIHSYESAGLFNVTLIVTDDDGLTDINTTTANISLDTDADGWSDEMEESYNTSISDPNDGPTDTDGDGTPDDPSNDGKYQGDTDDDNDGISDEIEEQLGSDPKNASDVKSTDMGGYVVDTNGDGKYDKFYNSTSGINTTMEIGADGKYKVDTNGDGKWDHIYNPANGEVTPYTPEEQPKEGFPWIPIIIVIIVVIILIIVYLFKIGYLYFEK